MAGIALEVAQRNLDKWVAASEAVTRNQSYTIDTPNGQRVFTRVNAEHIAKMIDYWLGKVRELSAPGASSIGGAPRRRTRYVVPQ